MTSPICKTFNYNNYDDVSSSKKIDVKLTYCDETVGKTCRRDIETVITQNFKPKQNNVYSGWTLFHEESRFMTQRYTERENHVRQADFGSSCFDWNKAVDGDAHVRGLATEEIPSLGFKPTWVIVENNSDKMEDIIPSDYDVLNNFALATFAVISASVIGYGVYSLYKRCTQAPANQVQNSGQI